VDVSEIFNQIFNLLKRGGKLKKNWRRYDVLYQTTFFLNILCISKTIFWERERGYFVLTAPLRWAVIKYYYFLSPYFFNFTGPFIIYYKNILISRGNTITAASPGC